MSFASYPSLKSAVVFVTRGASGIGAVVVDPESRLVPPAAALALLPGAEQFHYAGETGIGLRHVGVLVGRQAHAELWPQLTEWIGRQAHPRGRSRPHRGAGNRRTRATSALIRSRSRQQ